MTHWVPELLAPAGSFEKLKLALLYGANGVYLAGQKFGLRSAADNFSNEELKSAVAYAHARGARVYVTLNGFLHDNEIEMLPEFVRFLESIQVDAVIVSDLGVLSTVQKNTDLRIHLSTQSSCLNREAVKFWKELGVKRIVLGREVSIAEAKRIKEVVDIELEMFIHGAMCMSYSGHCTISNFTQGRDSNRGGCAQSCRFEYSFDSNDEKKNAFFMSSKDLRGVHHIPAFVDARIDSLKIEGRMKSHLYLSNTTKTYRTLLDSYLKQGTIKEEELRWGEQELTKMTYRSYCEGNLVTSAGLESVYDEREHEESPYSVCGIILESHPDYLLVESRAPFFLGDTLELLTFEGKNASLSLTKLTDIYGESLKKTRPGIVVKIPSHPMASEFQILRRCT